ncbi:hypothetical protein NP493_89g01041 [Ridgeia piscesae]|uniref:Uncharacterized protein n=1 Tax=Ridgeia piscesae TaxID=27915 RepID=A0AAD9P879_RIDPI|nr:hypothetical protein NP493_89g01041 [Ridgeia piscesae]
MWAEIDMMGQDRWAEIDEGRVRHAHWRDLLKAAQQCVFSSLDRGRLIAQLEALWTTKHNTQPCLPVSLCPHRS